MTIFEVWYWPNAARMAIYGDELARLFSQNETAQEKKGF